MAACFDCIKKYFFIGYISIKTILNKKPVFDVVVMIDHFYILAENSSITV